MDMVRSRKRHAPQVSNKLLFHSERGSTHSNCQGQLHVILQMIIEGGGSTSSLLSMQAIIEERKNSAMVRKKSFECKGRRGKYEDQML